MKPASVTNLRGLRAPLAGMLTWLVPGLGHVWLGDRFRGVIFMVVIAVTFWTGVAIGGVRDTVNPQKRELWFMGQICAGGHALGAWAWGRQLRAPAGEHESVLIAYGREEEIAVVYTAICGMLNVLIIFDVLVRAERRAEALPERGPPAPLRGERA